MRAEMETTIPRRSDRNDRRSGVFGTMPLNWLVLMVKNAATSATNHNDTSGTHIVIPRVVEPDGSQDEHGQCNEEAAEAHRVQISEWGRRVEARRENSS